ncbi:PIN domain-containing protein [Sutcliffiella halmapala]|uniref:PIN domain-containing protein n=1 Tax=Sutcliffiella halmapala TaxID=79882 RepID=UPI00099535DF|nr:PIN domain-containing protein [Sutcliffiella halmapala]
MSYLIFIDTNVVHNDFFFKSSAIKKLLKFTNHEPITLCITEFNYHEILKKYRDNVRPVLKEIRAVRNSVSKKIEELGIENTLDLNLEMLRAEKHVERYRQFLDKTIEDNLIQIVGYPTGENVVSHISEKYFNGIKPFGENKLSFQDAIFWQSIVEYCEKENPETIVFISNNTKDFADMSKQKIHEDLVDDISGLLFYNSVGSFLEHEEDNLHEYFIDNYEYDKNLLEKELINYFDGNSSLYYTINDLLMNSQFEGEYFSGWGTDGYINGMDFEILEVTLDIEENELLISFGVELDVSFSIETIDPTFERGDIGDGMISESSNAQIYLTGDITYSLDEVEMTDYVEKEIDFL